MTKVTTILLTGVLISLGTLVSVVSVSNLPPQFDRSDDLKEQLNALKNSPQTDEVVNQIADVQWQLNDLTESEKILYKRWVAISSNWKGASHKEFATVAKNLANVYMDHGNFDQALEVQKTVIDYDRKLFGEKSVESARDLNNLALCLYLKGTTLEDKSKRNEFFQKSLTQIQDSNEMWKTLKVKQSDFNIAINNKLRNLVSRDIVI